MVVLLLMVRSEDGVTAGSHLGEMYGLVKVQWYDTRSRYEYKRRFDGGRYMTNWVGFLQVWKKAQVRQIIMEDFSKLAFPSPEWSRILLPCYWQSRWLPKRDFG